MSLYRCNSLFFKYHLGGQWVHAVNGVSLEVQKGDFVCLTGPSGSGKSTLLNLLGLIEPVQEGEIHFDGISLASLAEREKNSLRRFRLGFVFQTFNLLEVLNAEENVEYFLVQQGLPLKERKARVERALKNVELWEHRHKRPNEMSGGQRQRVAIARSLAKNPDVILADEPTASLDQKTGSETMRIFKKLNDSENVTIITASHDPMVFDYAKRIVKMVDGRLMEGHA